MRVIRDMEYTLWEVVSLWLYSIVSSCPTAVQLLMEKLGAAAVPDLGTS